MTTIWLVPAFLLVAAATCSAQYHKHDGSAAHGRAPRTVAPRALASDALQTGRFEVNLAQQVIGKTVDYDVKQFAQRITHDHLLRNAELEALALAPAVNRPLALTPEQRALWDLMSRLALGDADEAYRGRAVASQSRLLQQYESLARRGRDPRVREFARRHLPQQREHLRQARRLTASAQAP